jgi:hypothetical protein
VQFDEFNAQQQPRVTWPATFKVARAYLDQLARSRALPAPRVSTLKSAIDKADKDKPSKSALDALDALAGDVEKDAASASGADAVRMKALASTIKTRTAKLRT